MPRSRAERLRSLVDRRGEVANRDVVEALGVSPATAHRLLQGLVLGEVLTRRGRGRAARYALRPVSRRFSIRGLEEDRAWQALAERITRIRPLAPDELRSLQYAATEILNNAVEHSGGTRVDVRIEFGAVGATTTRIRDDGVGVFRKLRQDFGFATTEDAIVQLEKGKLTSDPGRHSGEGLFFSSKAVSRFRLESQGKCWLVDNLVGDSALAEGEGLQGTLAVLEVVRGRTPRLEDIFRAWTDPETLRFSRTRATVRLSSYGTSLVSRSEARRLVAGLAKFRHVTLDFGGVGTVGQGFCDEVFRVFARAHPETALEPVGMNEPIAFMVARARAT
jgi:anti-sigma regulatory factor (Ser/Thr protein kinase)